MALCVAAGVYLYLYLDLTTTGSDAAWLAQTDELFADLDEKYVQLIEESKAYIRFLDDTVKSTRRDAVQLWGAAALLGALLILGARVVAPRTSLIVLLFVLGAGGVFVLVGSVDLLSVAWTHTLPLPHALPGLSAEQSVAAHSLFRMEHELTETLVRQFIGTGTLSLGMALAGTIGLIVGKKGPTAVGR